MRYSWSLAFFFFRLHFIISNFKCKKMALEEIKSKTKTRTAFIGVKDAVSIGSFVDDSEIPKSFKVVLDNTKSEQENVFLLGDALGGITKHLKDKGISPVFMAPEGVEKGVFKNYLLANPMMIELMRFEAKNSSSQFEHDVEILDFDVDGISKPQKFSMNEAVTSGQYNPKIQSYRGDISLGVRRAMLFKVDAGEKVIVTFYLKAILNRF